MNPRHDDDAAQAGHADDAAEMNRREFIDRSMRFGAGAFALAAAFEAKPVSAATSDSPAASTTGTASAGTAAAGSGTSAVSAGEIPRRPFGKTGEMVSILGVGGFHIAVPKSEEESIRIVHEAMDAGVNFMDNAWEYHGGRSEELMGKALQGRRDKAFLMTKVCTHGRDGKVAMQQLEESLRRLKTDVIDLWQIHEVVYWNDPEKHFAPGGAAEALLKAKEQGKVRFIGFTGHKHPDIHLKMLKQDFPFDACQLPLNCFDGSFLSFEKGVVPELNRRGIAPVGMKSLGGTGEMVKSGAVTADEALRYAMSLPVAVTVSGMDSLEVLKQNLAIARGFKPMSAEEMEALRNKAVPQAGDGRFELYKTTLKFEGKTGREQHGFPMPGQAPL